MRLAQQQAEDQRQDRQRAAGQPRETGHAERQASAQAIGAAAQHQLRDQRQRPHQQAGGTDDVQQYRQHPVRKQQFHYRGGEAEQHAGQHGDHRHLARIGPAQHGRRFTALRQRVHHARGAVEVGIERRQQRDHRDQGDGSAGTRNTGDIQHGGERRLQRLAGPRHHSDDHAQRADVEHQDAPRHGADGTGDAALRIFGLRRRNGHDLGTTEGEDHHQQRGTDTGQTLGCEAAMFGEVAQARRGHLRQPAHQQRHADGDERQDRRDLEDGEPELKLAEVLHPEQVDRGEEQHEGQRCHRYRHRRPDRGQQPGRAHRLGGDHDHQLHPPQPADRGTGGGAHGVGRIHRKRAAGRFGRRHLAQCVHHDDHQRACDQIRHQHCRTGHLHAHARTEEQAGADGAAQAHHDQLAGLERMPEAGRRSGRNRVGHRRGWRRATGATPYPVPCLRG